MGGIGPHMFLVEQIIFHISRDLDFMIDSNFILGIYLYVGAQTNLLGCP